MNPQKKFLISTLVTALFGMGFVTIAAAQTPPAPATAPGHFRGPHGPMMHGMPGGMMGSPFMHAVHQLNLTDAQKQSIHALLSSAHQQADTAHPNIEALANPGDPNYPAAVAAAKATAASRIQQQSDLNVQIYSLLTSEQQASLPKVLADMKAQHEQRRAAHTQSHS